MRIRTAVAVVLLSGLASLGVPSAAADELPPTPAETSSVTAPADEPLAELTPEPSEVPTSEVTPPEPQETAAPTEDAAEPSGEQSPTASDEASGESAQAADQSQPVEETDDAQAVEAGEDPGAAESGGSTEQATTDGEGRLLSSQAPANAVLDPQASIGDLNCTDLTLSVALDNSRSTGSVRFFMQVVRETKDHQQVFVEHQQVLVAAGATQDVKLPVTEDTDVSVDVWAKRASPVGGKRSFLQSGYIRVDCISNDVPFDPLASVDDVNCERLTVGVTLDNRRSTTDVTFQLYIEDTNPGDFQSRVISYQLSAGATRPVDIAVTEDSRVTVQVQATSSVVTYPTVLVVEHLDINCSPGGRYGSATVGDVDCNTLTVPITLDNTSVSFPSLMRVLWSSRLAHESGQRKYEIAAHGKLVVRIPAFDNSRMQVMVSNLGDEVGFDNRSLATSAINVNCNRATDVQGAKLPATGGFNLAFPLLGIALIASGAGTLALSRCRLRN